MSRVAPPSAPLPSPGWMVAMSLWLLPVLLGGGTTTWIGFAIIGLAVLKRSWIVAAVVYAVLSFIVTVGVLSSLGDLLQIALIAVGTIHGLIANRRWLITLWGRRERGVAPFGRGIARTGGPQPVEPPPVPARRAEPTYGELLDSGMLSVSDDPRLQPSAPVGAADAPDPAPLVPTAPGGPSPAPLPLGDPASTDLPRPVRPVLPTAPDTQWRPVSPSPSAPITSVPSSFAPPAPLVAAPESSAAAFLSGLRLTPLPGSSTVLPPREAVDPMTAGLEALSAIPAIGPERAARILAAREHGPLDSLQAVADAAGLQGFELVRIRPFLRFPPA